MLIAPYDEWVRLRKALAPVFHTANMRDFHTHFIDAALVLLDKIEEHNTRKAQETFLQPEETATDGAKRPRKVTGLHPINIDDYTMTLALDIITRVMFSKDLHLQRDDPKNVSGLLQEATTLFQLSAFTPFFAWVKPFKNWRYHRVLRELKGIMKEFIQERQLAQQQLQQPEEEEEDSGKKKKKDLLDLLLLAQDDNDNKLSMDSLISQSFTFYFAGHDTTAHTISWALWEVAKNPEVQDKIYAEITSVLGDNEHPTYEDIGRLTYISHVVKETLRLHPPVGINTRQLATPLDVEGFNIAPPGSIGVCIKAIQTSEYVWPEPWKFRPERFSEEESQGRHPCSWLPFSFGERNCIGMQFALLELRTVLSLVLKKYIVAPSVDRFPYSESRLTEIPACGVYINFAKRE